MPTYKEIQDYVRVTRSFVPKTCWIANILAEHGLTKRVAANRTNPDSRMHPCPAAKREALTAAMQELGALP
ncbi:hypothetical protein EN828_25305 [Mesorhizobium sp. M2D.F.Ca.ET.185.01.1.1]|nr:hypothetical protein EN783_26990 [Mesorhizobium sp. M2D.F.Ca.ET.140.01.1.1]TGP14856.1 hypothetical protein EN876_25450 [Mesorhizobium sp. M2D.F.Ca.ET.233.01.1.1]TGP31511.1 hypothetical protein EN875_021660 [Mesorhizobium sp. M2D.F.Ca.ET.232.01.1.1]TGP55758.1 hypothetical protein EN869_025395 [Mesorhizobium sp. M2D.F.Ca.ET.226.01.1.1]TGP68216.1 hypothetical protein EN868_11585 [Mesorhizobium sp. M2D.F.Ca.ET.225.01.1.1]TGP72137.1 hypothetical protein EN867_25645 [Mesorhizobium sp. M2D.F.Ca.ET